MKAKPTSLSLLGMVSLALGAMLSCTRPLPARGRVIKDLDIEGTSQVPAGDIEARLATQATTKGAGVCAAPPFFLCYGSVFVRYEVLDEQILARDLERVGRFYRARGFYEARVTAGRVVELDDRAVRVEIRVEEGQPVRVREITIKGIDTLPLDVAAGALRAVSLDSRGIFDEDDFENSAKAIAAVLGDAGHAFAEVKKSAKVDISTHQADVTFEVFAGPVARYGPVRIVGLNEVPERPVRANLAIVQGRRYSRKDLADARDALLNLGVFSAVEVRQDLQRPETHEVPITVVVRESTLRTLRLGGGLRFDVLRLSTHLRAGWEHRNFLGDLRHFSIEARPGLTYFPTRIGRLEAPIRILPEVQVHTELRQPAFIEGRTTGFIAGDFNRTALLYPLNDDVNAEEERIIGHNTLRAQVGVERRFFSHHLLLRPSYNWEANFPFMYQGGKPRGLDQVRVSYPEIFAALDFRDDPISPHQGFYLSAAFQTAGYVFGGTVSDFRIRPEARSYVPISRKVTFATRIGAGFLLPKDYGETLNPNETQDDPTLPEIIRDQHKLLFRAFYSGGPNSNRGYPFRGVGPQGPIGFLVPTGKDCSLRNRITGQVREISDLPGACIRPLGGLTLWEASAEVRFPIIGPLFGRLLWMPATSHGMWVNCASMSLICPLAAACVTSPLWDPYDSMSATAFPVYSSWVKKNWIATKGGQAQC